MGRVHASLSSCCCRSRWAATRLDPVRIYVRAVEAAASHDGSVGWCQCRFLQANSMPGADRALSRHHEIAPYDFRRPARDLRLGVRPTTAHVTKAVPMPAIASPASGASRAAAGIRAGWARMSGCCRSRTRNSGSLRLNRFGRPTIKFIWLFPTEQRDPVMDSPFDYPIGLRGTASDLHHGRRSFRCRGKCLRRRARSPNRAASRVRLYAFPQQTLYSVGIAAVALGFRGVGMLDASLMRALTDARWRAARCGSPTAA